MVVFDQNRILFESLSVEFGGIICLLPAGYTAKKILSEDKRQPGKPCLIFCFP
jgi:hypothetical protein